MERPASLVLLGESGSRQEVQAGGEEASCRLHRSRWLLGRARPAESGPLPLQEGGLHVPRLPG